MFDLPEIDSIKILIVEHDLYYLEEIANMLVQNGNQVIKSSSSTDGFQKAVEYLPDFVMIDESIQNMAGLDLCLRIKNEITAKDIFVVLFSCFGNTMRNFKEIKNVDGFISTSISLQELFLLVVSKMRIFNTKRMLNRETMIYQQLYNGAEAEFI